MRNMPTPHAATPSAIERHESYLRADPDNTTLRVALADLYHRAGRFDDALACLQPCLERAPAHAVARARVASVLISQQRFSEAEALLAPLTRETGDGALLHNLGIAQYQQRRFADARTSFERAGTALAATDAAAQAANARWLTLACHHLGDTAAALESGRRWAERGGDEAAGYLALVEMDHGDMAAAHQRAASVLARDPGNSNAAIVEAMWATETQEFDTAQSLFEGVAGHEQDNPRAWVGIGLGHLLQERHAAAIEAFETAARLLPGHAQTLTTLGWGRYVARDLAGAERAFRQAIAANRGFAEAHGGLALTLVVLQRYAEARRATRIALRLNPQGFGAVYAHGALMAIDGKRAQGEAEIAQALQRPIMADGRSLMNHLQMHLRRQVARGAVAEPPPPHPTEEER